MVKCDLKSRSAEFIERANGTHVSTFSLHTPRGLDATTGRPADPCIQATATLTLALPKRGLMTVEARPVVGRLFLADISVPAVVYARMGLGRPRLFEEWKYLLVRSDAHKDITCELLEKYVYQDKATPDSSGPLLPGI